MKRLGTLITVLLSVLFMCCTCYAQIDTDVLYDALPEDAREMLDDSGITPTGGAEKLGVSDIFGKLAEIVTADIDKPMKMFAAVMAVVMLSALLSSVSETAGGTSAGVYRLVVSAASAVVISLYLSEILAVSETSFTAVSDFMLTYIPVLAGVAAAGGHTASAAVYSSAAIIAIQVLSRLISSVVIPLASCIVGITAACGLDPDLKLDRLCEGVKKLVVWGLGLIMTLFLGILSIQSMITASADNAAMKTLKFAVSSSVPIVGGAVSDALSTVSGSIEVLKSGIGGFGIAAGVCMLLPPVITAAAYKLFLFLAGVVSDLFGCDSTGRILRSGENVMSVIIASLACMFTFVTVSSAILLLFCRS